MPSVDRELANFSLRGLSIEELRTLAHQFLEDDHSTVEHLDKADLVSQLSTAAPENHALSNVLRKKSISIKPSFYLMRFSIDKQVSVKTATANMARHLQMKSHGLSNLQYRLVQEYESNALQVLLTWETDLTYWAPTIQLERVRQLEFGFGIIDYRSQKAIIACHTLRERDEIAKLLSVGFSVKLTSLVLTKPLLEQIGTFDKVKRATYVIAQPDSNTPANIAYSDDNLGARRLALDEEKNPRSQRAQSFYRIPLLDSVLEEGLGATSDSGKLWLPKATPIDLVREYGTALLAKISGTLNTMAENNEIEAVLSTYKFDETPELSSADPMKLRAALVELVRTVIAMLANGEEERAYSVTVEIPLYGSPRFFCNPLLRLVDEESGAVALWTDSLYRSKSVRLIGKPHSLQVMAEPGKQMIDLDNLVHPLTGRKVQINNVLESLQLIPSDEFVQIIWDALRRISEKLPKLDAVKSVVFSIQGNILKLDVRRAFGELSAPTLIKASEVKECEEIFKRQTVHPTRRKKINEKLIRLGEKCTSMTDENCLTCVRDRKWICLRSLVGMYFNDVEILAHKGIELQDLSVRGTIGNKERRIWGFAKLPSGKSDKGLTARNGPGAVLLAQITGQLDKSTFHVVLVVTPSTVNQDLKIAWRSCAVSSGTLLLLFE